MKEAQLQKTVAEARAAFKANSPTVALDKVITVLESLAAATPAPTPSPAVPDPVS